MSNPNTAVFPGAAATDAQLFVAANNAVSILAIGVNATDTTVQLVDASGFNVPAIAIIEDEIVLFPTPAVANVFSGAVRGAQGTTATGHNNGVKVAAYIFAWHHNQIAAEVKAIESYLLNTIFRTNGTPNTIQSLLNLIAGANVTLTADGAGGVTIAASGGGGSLTLKTNGTANGSQSLLNLIAGANVTLTDNGTGGVTIAASGSGGGVGFGQALTPPVPADWSWINQGSSPLDTTNNQIGMIATGYEQWRMQAHSVPGGAWTATFGIMASAAFNDNFCSFGVMVKNAGTNTNYSVFKAMVQAGLFSLTTYNSPSGGVANIYQIGYQAASWINWLRIAFDTTTYRFQVSANGLQWVDFTTQTAASWVNAPAQVCFGGCGGNGGNSINVSLVSFTLV